MPLSPGSGRDVIEKNIHEMVASGHPARQAVAASLRNANYKRKGFALGGAPALGGLDASGGGGGLGFGSVTNTMGNLVSQPTNAFNTSWSSRGTMPTTTPQMPQTNVASPFGGQQDGGGWSKGAPAADQMGTGFMPPPVTSAPAQLGTGFIQPPAPTPISPVQPTVTSPPPVSVTGHVAPAPPTPPAAVSPRPDTNAIPMLSRDSGGSIPWFAKNEARSMAHVGPIHSIVAGRTDHIPLKVPGGSYVLPADYVSHLGQNNTNAGMEKANLMFGHMGPFGSTIPKGGHGRGAPHAPPAPRPPSSAPHMSKKMIPFQASGGKTFEGGVGDGDDIDIMAAGGEYVIHPDVVRGIGDGNIDHGHRILDQEVLRRRADHKKTLAELPPPAK